MVLAFSKWLTKVGVVTAKCLAGRLRIAQALLRIAFALPVPASTLKQKSAK